MTLLSFLLITLTPVALHAQSFQFGGGGNAGGGRAHVAASAADSTNGVPLAYSGTDADTTVQISTDSVGHILRGTHLQVIFVRVGTENGTRRTAKELAKVDPKSVDSLKIEQGDNLVRQYGNTAKAGVLTVMVKAPPAKPAKQANTSPTAQAAAKRAARIKARQQ